MEALAKFLEVLKAPIKSVIGILEAKLYLGASLLALLAGGDYDEGKRYPVKWMFFAVGAFSICTYGIWLTMFRGPEDTRLGLIGAGLILMGMFLTYFGLIHLPDF